MTKKFMHQGKEFEVRKLEANDECCIRVYCGNKLVSPTYSVSAEIENDFRAQNGKSMIEELENTAQNDVIRGLYIF